MSKAYRLKLMERLESPPLNDIPAKLRQLADRLDSGQVVTDAMILIFDDEASEGEMSVIGFGEYTPQEAHYAICLAQQLLLGR
jgi:hypothetical protein